MADAVAQAVTQGADGGSSWCGPAAISAITGCTTGQAAQMIADRRNTKRKHYQKKTTAKMVRGIYASELKWACLELGFRLEEQNLWDMTGAHRPTTKRVLDTLRGQPGAYILFQLNSSAGHFVAACGGTAYDNNNVASNKGVSYGAVRKPRKQVRHLYRAFDQRASVAEPNPEPAPVPAKAWKPANPTHQMSLI